ncbi:PSD1 and planctomycete cytochrome C domain-containing protein [Planctomycetaceae bacterium SH139]
MASGQTSQPNERGEQEVFFETHIRPLLIQHCYECHSLESGDSSGELRVDDRAALLRGGTRGPAVVPGQLDKSLLIRAVTYTDSDLEMPPAQKLPADKIELLRKWVAAGAYDPRLGPSDGPPATSEPSIDPRDHWAFQAPRSAAPVPEVRPAARDLIDAVVLNRVTKEPGISPAAEASAETLLRRLSYDLTGLPPETELAAQYLSSDRPDAYQRLVDQLLATPEFGQRWGRHWMDVARYADTVGYALGGQDRRIRGSERYRDWLIRSYNDDLPYDAMIRYQLAADSFDPQGVGGHSDAMGFITVGRRYLSRHDTLDDQIDVVTRGLLGITVACARCHDHKFDPVPTTDYYALYGIFNSSQHNEAEDSAWPLRVTDVDNPHDVKVFVRGQAGNQGPPAPRRFISVLESEQPQRFTQGSGRRELAEKIASVDNPLTARVYVNRVWSHLLGKPLIDSPSDFGVRTTAGEYPQILDDLAVQFQREGWSTKQLIRRIVLTKTYRQAATTSALAQERDPDNRLLARGNRRRLDFESLRDSILLVSGSLERRFAGPPQPILNDPTPPRRTVYAFVDRQQLPGVFRAFDFASPDAHSPQRYFTTVPQQALFLMNNLFVQRAARATVETIEARLKSDAKDNRQFANALFQQVLMRAPSKNELAMASRFLAAEAAPVVPPFAPQRHWRYGVGQLDANGLVETFRPFPKFVDGRYQMSDKFPDPQHGGYANLTVDGGHPGDGEQWAVMRRLIPDRDGTATVFGEINHPSDQGDGIRVTISSEEIIRWQEVVKANKRPFGPVTFPVRKGQPIDLIVDDHLSTSFDSFRWSTTIRITDEAGQSSAFDTMADFQAPQADEQAPLLLDRRSQLAQVLMMSNEFCFVD